jgi:3-deoxy-D-manno-octulosonic-acid transferase
MMVLYRLIFPLLACFALPYYALRMRKRGGYKKMMPGRLGFPKKVEKAHGKKRVWIQAVSVGELLAVEPIVEGLIQWEEVEVYLTTTTSTGHALALEKYGARAHVVAVESFPLDSWPIVQSAWNRINPDLAVITEGEIWPEHIHTAQSRGIPILLINARLSDRSYKRMRFMRPLRPLFFSAITRIGAGSELDSQRIIALGYPANKIEVTGNLKFDVADTAPLTPDERSQLLGQIGFQENSIKSRVCTLVGASTWPGEEQLLLESSIHLAQDGWRVQLVLVPRHAERRDEIRSLLESFPDVFYQFRSRPDWSSSGEAGDPVKVYVADTTGELRRFLQLASIAVIGKSFPPNKGGQTPVEAAGLGIPMIFGGSMSNFRSISASLLEQKGAFRVDDPLKLTQHLRDLLNDETGRGLMAEAALRVFQAGKGSSTRTLALIRKFLVDF